MNIPLLSQSGYGVQGPCICRSCTIDSVICWLCPLQMCVSPVYPLWRWGELYSPCLWQVLLQPLLASESKNCKSFFWLICETGSDIFNAFYGIGRPQEIPSLAAAINELVQEGGLVNNHRASNQHLRIAYYYILPPKRFCNFSAEMLFYWL